MHRNLNRRLDLQIKGMCRIDTRAEGCYSNDTFKLCFQEEDHCAIREM